MGGAACPLHDAGNDRSIERGSDLQAARRGSLTTPAKPAGERESDAALTPRPGTRPRTFLRSINDIPHAEVCEGIGIEDAISQIFPRFPSASRDPFLCWTESFKEWQHLTD